MLDEITDCTCEDKYTIEPHGKGYGIYFGRCDHNHGYRLAMLTEIEKDLVKCFERKLNRGWI